MPITTNIPLTVDSVSSLASAPASSAAASASCRPPTSPAVATPPLAWLLARRRWR